jgi:hypothetical protein
VQHNTNYYVTNTVIKSPKNLPSLDIVNPQVLASDLKEINATISPAQLSTAVTELSKGAKQLSAA